MCIGVFERGQPCRVNAPPAGVDRAGDPGLYKRNDQHAIGICCCFFARARAKDFFFSSWRTARRTAVVSGVRCEPPALASHPILASVILQPD